MTTKEQIQELKDMVHLQNVIIKDLGERVVKLERQADETETGVYYDHLDPEYTEYIDEGLRAKRGES